MAGVTVRMNGKRQHSLEEIHGKITEKVCGKFHDIGDTEEVSKTAFMIGDVEIWVLSYEKYYLRVHSCAALTIVMAEREDEQTACVVASAGGSGYANRSWGANRDFAKSFVQLLESCGFQIADTYSSGEAKDAIERAMQIFD